jgi:hypothetical protein
VRGCVEFTRVIQFLTQVKEYERTGYVWEQYDPNTGEGKRRCVPRTLFVEFWLMKIYILVILSLDGPP